jgi:hypothetical protein
VGDPLSQESLESFSEELQKMAAGEFFRRAGAFLKSRLRHPSKMGLGAAGRIGKVSKGIFGGGDEAFKRIIHPVEGVREGWRASSPLYNMRRKAKEMGFKSVQEAAQSLKSKGDPKAYQEFLDGGEHLLGTKPGTGRFQSLAEELSRQGWTGAGRRTKYLPVGNKGLMVGFSGMAIPDIVNAPKATPTGEGGALEQGIGELGGSLGMIAGTGLGFVPAMGMWYGGRALSSRLGRVMDRVRSGATLKDAVMAPSPEEAASQLESIQKYYG